MTEAGIEAVWALLASFFVLASGPLLVKVAARSPAASAALDGFSMGAVVLLVLVHLLPPVLESLGPWALLALLGGLLLPRLFHRLESGLLNRSAQGFTVLVVIGGLALHAALDGAALPLPGPEGRALRLAVVIHRLPLAMLVWTLMRGRFGIRIAILSLVALGTFSAFGLYLGAAGLGHLDSVGVSVFQAVMVGSLLHLLFDNGPPTHVPRAEGAGALLGFIFVALLPHDDHGHVGIGFLHLALDAAPALLAGAVLAGAATLLPAASPARLGPGWGGLWHGLVWSVPRPLTAPQVIDHYQRLWRHGVPGPALATFLIATSTLSLEAVALSLPLLGPRLTAARVAAGVALALALGLIVGPRVPPVAAPEPTNFEKRSNLGFGLVQGVDQNAAWLLFGLAAAAALSANELVPGLTRLPPGVDVAVFALIAAPLYVCAAGATPLAAALIAAGASPGAALAFLLAGPATNLVLFGRLRRLHGDGVAWLQASAATGLAMVAGWVVNLAPAPIPGHGHGEHFGPASWLALGTLGLFLVGSLLRQGLRGLLAGLLGESVSKP